MGLFILPLRDWHFQIAEQHALIRNSRKRAVNVVDEKVSDDDDSLIIDKWGALAEVIAAEALKTESPLTSRSVSVDEPPWPTYRKLVTETVDVPSMVIVTGRFLPKYK